MTDHQNSSAESCDEPYATIVARLGAHWGRHGAKIGEALMRLIACQPSGADVNLSGIDRDLIVYAMARTFHAAQPVPHPDLLASTVSCSGTEITIQCNNHGVKNRLMDFLTGDASQPSPAATVETNSPEQDRESDCKTKPELTGHSPKERGERVLPHLSAATEDARPVWQQLQLGLLLGMLSDWRNADHEDSIRLGRSDVIAIIDGFKSLRTAQPQPVKVTDEMVTAAMRAFEPMSSVLRYREKDKWHSCDIMGMRDALKAALAVTRPHGGGK